MTLDEVQKKVLSLPATPYYDGPFIWSSQLEWLKQLERIVDRDANGAKWGQWELINATAAQRNEAYLRVTNMTDKDRILEALTRLKRQTEGVITLVESDQIRCSTFGDARFTARYHSGEFWIGDFMVVDFSRSRKQPV